MDITTKLYQIPLAKLDEIGYMKDNPNLVGFSAGVHEPGYKQIHSLKGYKRLLNRDETQPPLYYLYWTYCHYCFKTLNKKVVGFDDGTGTAYVRQILSKGEFVDK